MRRPLRVLLFSVALFAMEGVMAEDNSGRSTGIGQSTGSEQLTSSGQLFSSGPNQVSLVELYTSEGCSSCPPADKWLSGLEASPELWRRFIPVAFHVDYWDYLGWKDPFARKLFSRRQYRYKLDSSVDSVYTPGFVVAGDEWRGWFGLFKKDLPLSTAEVGNLQVELNSENRVKAVFSGGSPGKYDINIALLGFDLVTDVKRGENRGRQLRHDFVVLEYHVKPLENDEWQIKLSKIDRREKMALAAWVSPSGKPRPLQAVGGWVVSP